MIEQLRELGIEIDIDDFGTGHASMVALTSLQPHRIKIDRSLVADSCSDDRKIVLLSSVADMAHSLGIKMIAEGIETAEELEQVAALGIDEVQGFFFSPALQSSELAHYLARQELTSSQVA
jgi:EAL domain-containing protein (putative c-di-GMP-specific phosphodiesterase class I)